jgi:carboxylesterase type B
MLYPGSDLLKGAHNAFIVVVIQYRLGLFGFLSGTGVKEGGGDFNVGLCACFILCRLFHQIFNCIYLTVDQQFALKWVQEHVSSSILSSFSQYLPPLTSPSF